MNSVRLLSPDLRRLFVKLGPLITVSKTGLPVGPETLSFWTNRDPNNRGNTYPPSLWLSDPHDLTHGIFPAWDCKNTGAGGSGAVSPTAAHPGCWVAPKLPGASGQSKIPHIARATYSSR